MAKFHLLKIRLPIQNQLTMPINFQTHAFTGNPLRIQNSTQQNPISLNSAVETLKNHILETTHEGFSPNFKVLPFKKGRPLAGSSPSPAADSAPIWHLGWISFADCKEFLAKSEIPLSENLLVYLGSESEEDVVYWAIDITDILSDSFLQLGDERFVFIELRTLMVASDLTDARTVGELAIAGHARALLEWHTISRFCGQCGTRTIPVEGGRRKQCVNERCKKRIYPRIDPVVIMLVIDKENDRALLTRQSRFVPRMWSCLAGFIEPGETLEEAVRRETWEEAGIEVDEVVYHSSQPWPVGPNSMPCQLMVGFFAYAKSFDVLVNKKELEDAEWHSREDVKKALSFAEYEKAQKTAAINVDQLCRGVEKGDFSGDFNVESGELAPMFIPGPFAISHHLISSWVNQTIPNDTESPSSL